MLKSGCTVGRSGWPRQVAQTIAAFVGVVTKLSDVQDKKKLEEERQKELNDLFAVAIKQPKVPAGRLCTP
jgi:hypothetical protein